MRPRPWLVVNDGHKNYSDHKDPPVIVHTHTHTLAPATPSALAPYEHHSTLSGLTQTQGNPHTLSQLHCGTAAHDHTRPRQAAERNATS